MDKIVQKLSVEQLTRYTLNKGHVGDIAEVAQ